MTLPAPLINNVTGTPLNKSKTPVDHVPQVSQDPQEQGQVVTVGHSSVLVSSSGSQAWPPHSASRITRLLASL